jgi:hypothetical protein
MVVLIFMGIATVVGSTEWIQARKNSECMAAARLMKSFLLEARMLSIYKGNSHFVVFNPSSKTLSLYADTSAPLGVYNTTDTRIRMEQLPSRANLSLPASPSPLASPLGTGNLGSAWGIALPDTSGAYGSTLRGVRATANGQIETVEATPQTVTAGTIVLSDIDGNTVAVGVRGQLGSVRAFKLVDGVWKES